MQTVHASRATMPTPPRWRRRSLRWVVIVAVVIVVGVVGLRVTTTQASDTKNAVHSGFAGACLDVFHGGVVAGTPIDSSSCNGTAAQNWVTTATTIKQLGTNDCVTADSNGAVTLRGCVNAANQVWLRDQQGYFNPNSTECLGSGGAGEQLKLTSCSNMSWLGLEWTPDVDAQAPACGGSQGEVIACDAAKEWAAWQANGSNHEALLTTYTDGTPYEEWCADFVSYVYKEAGDPFTNGSADGWDENNANGMADLTFANQSGFTVHQASSGYVPKAGDVAFFDYPGGHVEIVVSGGKKPSFVYGDYEVKDPTTGNGQMWSNTVLQNDDGIPGQVMYYLTPNS